MSDFFLKKVLFGGGERVKTWRKMAVMLKYGHTLNQVLQRFRILFQAFYAMPEIATLSDPGTWDGAAALLYSLSNFIASPLGLALFVSALFLAAAALGAMPFWTGKWRLRVEKLPPWSLYRLVVGSVWLFTLATLLRGGTQMEEVFGGMLKSGSLSPWLAERVAAIKNQYRSEGNFGHILLNLGMHFPDDELNEDLAVYATLPKFDETLYKISREWLEDGVKRIGKTAQILNGVLMLSIAFMTAWMAFGHSLGPHQKPCGAPRRPYREF